MGLAQERSQWWKIYQQQVTRNKRNCKETAAAWVCDTTHASSKTAQHIRSKRKQEKKERPRHLRSREKGRTKEGRRDGARGKRERKGERKTQTSFRLDV
tara:strand:- start:114 stop:410 length:297 start_codon:yes stop_codon:yes gene_type:complete